MITQLINKYEGEIALYSHYKFLYECPPMEHIEHRQHTNYIILTTINLLVHSPRPFNIGMDSNGYRHGNYGWRHQLLNRLYFLEE